MSRKHPLSAFQLLVSLFLQVMAYYGFRSILFLYVIDLFANNYREIIMGKIAWLSGGIVLAGVLGGYVGDRFAGHRRASLAGLLLQAAGLFLMAVPRPEFLFAGLAIIALGAGFYRPNLLAQYAKHYLAHPRLLDAAVVLWFLTIDLGGFFGPMVGKLYRIEVAWPYIFSLLGFLMLLAAVPVYELKNIAITNAIPDKTSRRWEKLILVAVLVLIFDVFAYYGMRMLDIKLDLHINHETMFDEFMVKAIEFSGWIVISFYLFYRWSRSKKSSFERVVWAFVLGAMALGLYGMFPATSAGHQKIFKEISYFLLMFSSIFMAPLWSVVIRQAPPKHLALWVSLLSLYQWLIGYFIFLFPDFRNDSKTLFLAGFVLFFLTAAGLYYWARSEKKTAAAN